jgi:HEAT repeat protein
MPVFAKWIKKITSIFAEKTPVKTDEFELEHFMVYHGLVGTSPENQRKFKDVRADMKIAIDERNSQQVAAMLKLEPLLWEEKLKTIFGEYTDRELLLAVLAPDINEESLTFEDVPLLHEDWQVRANAALLLAHMEATEVIDKVVRSLHDTASNARNAFPHISNALGRLGTTSSEEALLKYIIDEDPWIRVDIAAALSHLQQEKPSQELLNLLLDKHAMSDYTAVAVSKSISPVTFFQNDDELSIAAGCQIVTDLLLASSGTFSKEIAVDLGAPDCLPALVKLLDENPSCIVAATAISLAEWMEENHSYLLMNPPSQPDLEKVLAYSKSEACAKLAKETLIRLAKAPVGENTLQLCELRSAIALTAMMGDASSVDALVNLLTPDHPLLDDVIETLSRLKATSAAPKMIEIARGKVDLNDRWQQPKQLNPVQETNRAKAKTYWLVLKALSAMPSKESAQFLLEATEDHAPDKRAQALASLIAVAPELDEATRKSMMPAILNRLADALSDQSADVRKSALRGVATFEIVSDLGKVVELTRAREVSTQREAFDTLSELAKKGHKKDVVESVAQALKTEPNVHKRQKLRDFLDDTDR